MICTNETIHSADGGLLMLTIRLGVAGPLCVVALLLMIVLRRFLLFSFDRPAKTTHGLFVSVCVCGCCLLGAVCLIVVFPPFFFRRWKEKHRNYFLKLLFYFASQR